MSVAMFTFPAYKNRGNFESFPIDPSHQKFLTELLPLLLASHHRFHIYPLIHCSKMPQNQNGEEEIDLAAEAVPLTSALTSIFDPLQTGFVWYVPPLASEQNQNTGGHKWNIVGHDMQVLTMTVPGGGTVITEVGSFMYMSPFMETSVELTLCSPAGCVGGWNRICGGESCVKVVLKNGTHQEGYVGLTPNFPAKIIPVSILRRTQWPHFRTCD